MDTALSRRVEQQRVEMLSDNTLAVSGSALLMAALISVIAWPHTRVANVVGWCVAVLFLAGAAWAAGLPFAFVHHGSFERMVRRQSLMWER